MLEAQRNEAQPNEALPNMESGKLRVLIAVTHLLGIGHFARMAALSKALAQSGHAVLLASGGRPVPLIAAKGVEWLQLPPVHCLGSDFSTLYTEDGELASPSLLETRARMLAEAVPRFSPDIVITELFPFGRRILAAEFEALLAAARALTRPPAILCSIRDVLNPPSKPSRAASVLARLAADYDCVLVHADQAAMPLEVSWPVEPALARRLRYCGYLRDADRGAGDLTMGATGPGEILVSAGGSAAGEKLCAAAIEAAHLLPAYQWRILVAPSVAPAVFAAFGAAAPGNALVERARPDFPALLQGSALSISQAGYNTVLDLAASGARALLVPFAAGGEREQGLRAQSLAEKGFASVLEEEALTAMTLALAAQQALAGPRPDWSMIALDGAARVVKEVVAFGAKVQARHQAWTTLDETLARFRKLGKRLDFWIRDDDAVENTPALQAFAALLARHNLPAALAVIPNHVQPSLAMFLADHLELDVLVHGFAHKNHADKGEKAAEFGDHRPLFAIRAELAESKARLEAAFGARALPVFVPPWNRIADKVRAELAPAGFCGLSAFGPRRPGDAPGGLRIAHTHWDPIAWREGGGLKDEAHLLHDLVGLLDGFGLDEAGERGAIGLLTHHLVHDGWISRFLDEVLSRILQSGIAQFLPAREVFGLASPPASA